jgi:hypothetical protein
MLADGVDGLTQIIKYHGDFERRFISLCADSDFVVSWFCSMSGAGEWPLSRFTCALNDSIRVTY